MTDAADELFVLPPQDFVAARNVLVKRLRAEGKRSEADAVKALRRPPVSAWALNQLAREDPDQVAELVEAGEELPAAQQALLAGDADRFRQAVQRHRELLGELADAGAELVVEREVSAGDHRQDIADDLRAASTIPAARQPFRQGRLTERPANLGEPETGLLAPVLGAEEGVDRPAAGTGRGGDADTALDVEAESRAEARRASAARRRHLVERVDQARRHVEELEDARDRAASELAGLQAEVERARQAASAAERDATAARDQLADLEADLAHHDADPGP